MVGLVGLKGLTDCCSGIAHDLYIARDIYIARDLLDGRRVRGDPLRLSEVDSVAGTLEKSLQEERAERKMWQAAAKEAKQVVSNYILILRIIICAILILPISYYSAE